MERLTKRINDVVTYIGTENEYDTGMIAAETASSVAAVREILLRLAAYEDTGLTPEEVTAAKVALMGKTLAEITEFEGVPIARLRELAEADKAGRVLILPCAPDAIYWEKVGGILAQSRFEGLHVYEDGTIKYAGYGIEICSEDIGKTVFLTGEEAEKALQEMEGKKDG